MSNQKKQKTDMVSVVGVAACILAIVWMFYRNRPSQVAQKDPQEPKTVMTTTEQPKNLPVEEATSQTAENGENATPAETTETAVANVPLRSVTDPRPASGMEPILLRKGDDAIIAVDPAGNGITSVTLPKYALHKKQGTEQNDEPVVLGNAAYPFLSLSLSGQWSVSETLIDDNGTKAAVTRKSEDGNLLITETWDVSSEKPSEIRYSVDFRNIGTVPCSLKDLRVEGGAMPTSVSPDRKAGRGESSGGFFLYLTSEDKVKEYNMASLKKLKEVEAQKLAVSPVTWAAIHSKYFLLAFYRTDNASFAGVEAAAIPSMEGDKPQDLYHVRAILPDLVLQPGEEKACTMTAYAGPKNYEQLYALDNGLDSVMQMNLFFFWRPAWMGFISRWLLRLLVKISSWFPPSVGWGLAIIILTFALKVLFWPLTHKSTVSMRKMAALRPEIDKLREQYKGNPQMLYRKQQELMKANGVSQMGGCLPLLLQIPVFFALFNTFRNAIELRHSSFLWAYDLSMPDTLAFSPDFLPIRPFAILMGVAMYFQQKMTPNPDPKQAQMMSFMTIFFIFLFYGMPSALTLYLTVTYLLGILQSWMANRNLANAPQKTA